MFRLALFLFAGLCFLAPSALLHTDAQTKNNNLSAERNQFAPSDWPWWRGPAQAGRVEMLYCIGK